MTETKATYNEELRKLSDLSINESGWITPWELNVKPDGTCWFRPDGVVFSDSPFYKGHVGTVCVKITRKSGGFIVDVRGCEAYHGDEPYRWCEAQERPVRAVHPLKVLGELRTRPPRPLKGWEKKIEKVREEYHDRDESGVCDTECVGPQHVDVGHAA